MQLWSSHHPASALVALALIDDEIVDPDRGPVSMPSSVRVVDEATAERVEALLRERATSAAAAGVPVSINLDAVVARVERATRSP